MPASVLAKPTDRHLFSLQNSSEYPSMNDNKKTFIDESKKGNFFDAFMAVINDAVQLEIVTIVEDEEGVKDEEGNDRLSNKHDRTNYKGQPGKRLISTIGLLDGDIQNIRGRQFVTDPVYNELQKFHEAQVAKGEQIIKANLESLHNALSYLIAIYKKTPSKTIPKAPTKP